MSLKPILKELFDEQVKLIKIKNELDVRIGTLTAVLGRLSMQIEAVEWEEK